MDRTRFLVSAALLALLVSTAEADYINVFNIEGESSVSAQFVTYSSLGDMLLDTNRLSVFTPTSGAGENIVGSGASVTSSPGGGSVPEPSAWGLFVLGLVALRSVRRRIS